MGFTMRTIAPPTDTELDALTAARDQFNAAVKARDEYLAEQLPDATWADRVNDLGYLEHQAAVEAAGDDLIDADPNTYRINDLVAHAIRTELAARGALPTGPRPTGDLAATTEAPGIAAWKLETADGWHVTPTELLETFSLLDTTGARILPNTRTSTLPPGVWPDAWADFVRWIEHAVNRGGFTIT